jgi:hypothetical protein
MRFSTGRDTGHNAAVGPDLFPTFDPEDIKQVGSSTALRLTRRTKGKSQHDSEDVDRPPGKAAESPDWMAASGMPFDDEILTSGWQKAGITIEVKNDRALDPKLHCPQDAQPDLTSMSIGQREFLLQSFGYVRHGQWPAFSSRIIRAITVADNLLRIWRWSSTSGMVANAIKYEKGPAFVFMFLQAVGQGSYPRSGPAIGQGMTFTGAVHTTLEIIHILMSI